MASELIDERWKLIDTFFEDDKNRLVAHQVASYNQFIEDILPQIVTQYNPTIVYCSYSPTTNAHGTKIHISFDNVALIPNELHENNGGSVPLRPEVARHRNCTYTSNILVDVTINYIVRCDEKSTTETYTKHIPKVCIGKMPIMYGSKLCISTLSGESQPSRRNMIEPSGYFIVHGSEKVVIAQERQAESRPYCYKNPRSHKYSHVVEVKSTSSRGYFPTKSVSVKITTKSGEHGPTIYVTCPNHKHDIPCVVLFRVLGIESDEEIANMVSISRSCKLTESEYDIRNMLAASLYEGQTCPTSEHAYAIIAKYVNCVSHPREVTMTDELRRTYVDASIENDIFPHIAGSRRTKAKYLAILIRKLILFRLGHVKEDDRDRYSEKRIDTVGSLLTSLFRQAFTRMSRDMRGVIMKEVGNHDVNSINWSELINTSNIYKFIKSSIIEHGIRYSLSTGNWGVKLTTTKVGVAQVLNRLSFIGTLSHLRRINTPIDKTSKLTKPRQQHGTGIGYICSAETPEGASIGIVKNLALSSTITQSIGTEHLKMFLFKIGTLSIEHVEMDIMNAPCHVMVYVNGEIVGVHSDMIIIRDAILNARRCGQIHIHTSIVPLYSEREIHFYTDSGRLTRPLLIVRNGCVTLAKYASAKLTWSELLHGRHRTDDEQNIPSLVEYVDVTEADTVLIAMRPEDVTERTTHCEIDPSLILGVSASLIPFPDHNQSPRVCYQSAMGKQAMGVYSPDYRDRMDSVGNILHMPMRPLVSTRASKYMHVNELSYGQELVVAIMSNKGYNQEDSIIMNKGSVDRGMFRSDFYRTYHTEERKSQVTGDEEIMRRPNQHETIGMRTSGYENIREDGLPIVNARVNSGDPLIGKVVPLRSMPVGLESQKRYRDISLCMRHNESGFVDRVYVNHNAEGYRFCKVRTRSERIPNIGDKFASEHAQKGTVGMIYDQCDMPYTEDGIVPDIIINPHAIPSRMTFGHLLQSLLGELCSVLGMHGDGTPFTGLSMKAVTEKLSAIGLNPFGEKIMYSAETGKKFASTVFCGPIYYQRLKHMVDDKIHARSTGPVVMLTRQPSEGRSRDGGLRVGEMERDVLIAHGASQFLKEKMVDLSDAFAVYVDEKKGTFCAVNKKEQIIHLTHKGNRVQEVIIPYSMKLFCQELAAMGVLVRLKT